MRNSALEGLKEISDCVRWYWRDFSPKYTIDEKEGVLRDLVGYNLSPDARKEPPQLSDFPEIEKHWPRDDISGLELAFIADELYRELGGEDDIDE
jgi:hypothetical protein